GHTSRVEVQEGIVVLRVRGIPPVALGAGERWTAREAEAARGSEGGLGAEGARGPGVPTTATAARDVEPPRTPAAAGAPPPHALGSSRPAANDPSIAFRAAMAALDRGDA